MRRTIVVTLGLCLGGSFLLTLSTGYMYGKEEKKEYTAALKLERVERDPLLEAGFKVQDGKLFDSQPFAVVWSPVPEGFRFRIYNKLSTILLIQWNECKFIDEKGNAHPISHQGIKRPSLSEMKVMGPKDIPPGGDWQDVIFPYDSDYIEHEKELVSFSQGAAANRTYGQGGLRIRPIFIDKYQDKQVKKIEKKERKKNADFNFESYINNHTYQVVLSLNFNETKYLYRFFFRAFLLDNP